MYSQQKRTVSRDQLIDPNELSRIWCGYFPETEIDLTDPKLHLIAQLRRFFASPEAGSLLSLIEDGNGACTLPIDFERFKKICGVQDLYVSLQESPKEALLCLGAAAHMALCSDGKYFQLEDIQRVNVRLHNHCDSLIALKNLKAAYIKKLVSMRGTVVKVSTVKPLVQQMDFSCGKCGTVVSRIFSDGKFSPPTSCCIYGCKSKTFSPIRANAKLIDFQKIRIQELLKSENHEEGRVPRTVECELSEDLVDSCIPGDIVTVTGIVKESQKTKVRGCTTCTLKQFQS